MKISTKKFKPRPLMKFIEENRTKSIWGITREIRIEVEDEKSASGGKPRKGRIEVDVPN